MKSHDGITDSLTHLALPAMLYEELQRELARARRSGGIICGIKILLQSPEFNALANQIKASTQSTNLLNQEQELFRHSDRETLLLAQSLTHETRGEDICARMGNEEFLILLIDCKATAQIFIDRFILHWKERRERDVKVPSHFPATLIFSHANSSSQDTMLDFLNRIDAAEANQFVGDNAE